MVVCRVGDQSTEGGGTICLVIAVSDTWGHVTGARDVTRGGDHILGGDWKTH